MQFPYVLKQVQLNWLALTHQPFLSFLWWDFSQSQDGQRNKMAISGTFITKNYLIQFPYVLKWAQLNWLALTHQPFLSILWWDFQNLQTISWSCYLMVKDQKMAFTGRYWPNLIQIYFICENQMSKNSHPSEKAVN